jgi:small-conductance mechanosensitive channel
MGQQQINVVTVQPTPPVAPKQTTVVVRSSNETAERAILFSMINAICCNLFFGIIAMFIALAAKDYIKNGREEEGRRLIRAASIINIVGVISSAVIVLTVIIVLATS